jgi:hypothetical protein
MALPEHGKKARKSGTKRYQDPQNGTKRYHFSTAIPGRFQGLVAVVWKIPQESPGRGSSQISRRDGCRGKAEVAGGLGYRCVPSKRSSLAGAVGPSRTPPGIRRDHGGMQGDLLAGPTRPFRRDRTRTRAEGSPEASCEDSREGRRHLRPRLRGIAKSLPPGLSYSLPNASLSTATAPSTRAASAPSPAGDHIGS